MTLLGRAGARAAGSTASKRGAAGAKGPSVGLGSGWANPIRPRVREGSSLIEGISHHLPRKILDAPKVFDVCFLKLIFTRLKI